MKLWAQDDAVLIGTSHQPWPVTGCGCLTCRAGAAVVPGAGVVAGAAPTELSWGPLTLLPDGYRGAGQGAASPLAPGETVEVHGVRLLALPGPTLAPGADCVLVAGRGGRSLLWAPVAGPLPEETLHALQDGGLDAAVLDLRGATGPPDPVGLAQEVARLRAVGALAEGAPVLVVGWTHESDPAQLQPLLSTWGLTTAVGAATGCEPASTAHSGTPSQTGGQQPWRTLVLGPASSGKSRYAEALLAAEPAVDYLATGAPPSPDDPEWTAKVDRHRQRRPTWWRTVESTDLAAVLAVPGAPVLLDSLGTWTAATLQRCGAWDDVPDWQQQWEQEVAAVVQAWRGSARRVVAVGEETGWGVVPPSSAGRIFRDCLGELSRLLADQSERVVLVVAGRPLDLTPAGGTA